MAQHYDEGIEEGNSTKSAESSKTPTLEQWLKNNRLSKIAPYLKSQGLVSADFCVHKTHVISVLCLLQRWNIKL